MTSVTGTFTRVPALAMDIPPLFAGVTQPRARSSRKEAYAFFSIRESCSQFKDVDQDSRTRRNRVRFRLVDHGLADRRRLRQGEIERSDRADAVIQRVARGAHGADEVLVAALVERFAQAADMDIDGAKLDFGVASPHRIEQLLAR